MGAGPGFMDQAIRDFIVVLEGMDGTTAYLVVLGTLGLCGLGLPVPEDIILITAGFLSALGKFSLWSAILAGMVGVLSGDAVLFFLGRRYGPAAFDLPLIRRLFTPERREAAQQRVLENARFICFIARFLPGLRSPIYLTAGAMQIPPRTYIMQDGFAAAISVPVWVYVGWYFGDRVHHALDVAAEVQMWVGLGVILTIVMYVWHKRQERDVEEGA